MFTKFKNLRQKFKRRCDFLCLRSEMGWSIFIVCITLVCIEVNIFPPTNYICSVATPKKVIRYLFCISFINYFPQLQIWKFWKQANISVYHALFLRHVKTMANRDTNYTKLSQNVYTMLCITKSTMYNVSMYDSSCCVLE